MSSYQEQIQQIEDEIRTTKKNKATNSHVGKLKAKLARLKREQQDKLLGGGGGGDEDCQGHSDQGARLSS